jgi:hypothetical protein
MLVNGMQFVMCRLCAMNQVEETAQRRARLVARLAARAENDEEHVQSGLTIRIPPRVHCICPFCHTDYLLPLTGNQLDHCQPCQTYKGNFYCPSDTFEDKLQV